MSSNAVHAFTQVDSRVQRLSDLTKRVSLRRDMAKASVLKAEEDIACLDVTVRKLTLTSELFLSLMDLMVEKQVRPLEKVVSQGVKSIFWDLDLSFEAEVGVKYNKTSVDFFFRQHNGETGVPIRGKPLSSFGGGPASIASLILRTLTVLRLKLFPVLILDETLFPVSDEYIEQASQFLSSLAAKMGVDILLVTHKRAFLEKANRAYLCAETKEPSGGRSLSIRSLK